ncbi:hypothetical protein ElyMa_002443000 [Elysia marginata]|uniref:Uncharacterized protein n=1 Tax=Elysia marginata TaxID=1093978 RepID=A0AAV4GJ88_9GAST|nr:hypothetical protein ElyMa_002443000 [Elysia marginata]
MASQRPGLSCTQPFPSTAPLPSPPAPSTETDPLVKRPRLSSKEQAVEEESDIKRTILELPHLGNLLNELRCHECHSDERLQLATPSRYGMAVKIEAVCRNVKKYWQAGTPRHGMRHLQANQSLL